MSAEQTMFHSRHFQVFNWERLLDTLLDSRHHRWREEVIIHKEYMPPHPREDSRPEVQVEYKNRFLRYSRGPLQGYFWDVYGEDMHTPELAFYALLQAPSPLYPRKDDK